MSCRDDASGDRSRDLDSPPHLLTRWSSRGLEASARALGLRVVGISLAPVAASEVALHGVTRLAPIDPDRFPGGGAAALCGARVGDGSLRWQAGAWSRTTRTGRPFCW